MGKTIGALLVCLLLTATAARAEHKLLITEVLDAGQFEAQASYEFMRFQQSFTVAGERSRAIINLSESMYSIGVGLGHGLEVTASIPYVFSERLKEQTDLGSVYDKKDGFGDFRFGGKYSLLEEGHGPVTLVAGLDVKFETAGGNSPGTKTTDVSPYLAVSKKLGHHFIPYGSYRAIISNHGAADSHILSIGSENELNETFTIDTRVDAAFRTATDGISSQEAYRLEVASYIQLCHNFYLIPSVAVATGSTSHIKVTDGSFGSPFSIAGGISLYYLF